MDVRSDVSAIPLAVDLDGTLIATDLLWEGLFLLLRKNPLYLFLVPFWVFAGPARLKHEIAKRVEIDPASLPYRPEVLERIAREQAAGRRVVLATGTPKKFATAIAEHLGLFDAVLATEGLHNLTSKNKVAALTATYGDGGFDYIGNSRHDVALFDAARQAIVIAPDRHASRWQLAHGCELIDTPKPTAKTVLKMLRVHQWLKNGLIFVPLLLAHEYQNPRAVLACVIAFVSFSAAASAIYIINDFFDLALDRQHRTKRHRPFASGLLSMPFGFACSGLLLVISVVTAAFLPPLFWLVIGTYLVTTTAYTFSIKRMLLIDVLTLAGLYTIRVLAGQAATDIEPSFWLLAFSIFFFLSLALVKRYVELRSTVSDAKQRIAGRGYRPEDQDVIAQAGMGAAFAAVVVMALYIDSSAVSEQYNHPYVMWPLAPIVLYMIMRIWILARRDEMHDDPVVFIITDWRSQLMAALGLILILIAVVLP
ncbi:UbiA family prenyltransferase [Tianweitania sediminis]|uniref:UbiA family prenyltransferase n=1 Tax=Tianweitania sediminis TaxID=1502156 RepID=A0A8J7UIZ0_9HYPH|nr:UbiA family prenyltransferase [Tianweitania sediminis]MBP0440749.1 UbiA family prenyltransferase [Tianweitania sediminis]